MRGGDCQQAGMWSDISPEQRVPFDHPRRSIRATGDAMPADTCSGGGTRLTIELQAAGQGSATAARLREMEE